MRTESASFLVNTYDSYGNERRDSSSDPPGLVTVTVQPATLNANITNLLHGAYLVQFTAPDASSFVVTVAVGGVPIKGSPFEVVGYAPIQVSGA